MVGDSARPSLGLQPRSSLRPYCGVRSVPQGTPTSVRLVFARARNGTIRALLNDGQYDRARQELEFILNYQDQKTGMIWHELSQSAGWLDWAKYPYMYLHIDLTFDFLNTIAEYLSVSGDHDFVTSHWIAIQSAHEYCRSLL